MMKQTLDPVLKFIETFFSFYLMLLINVNAMPIVFYPMSYRDPCSWSLMIMRTNSPPDLILILRSFVFSLDALLCGTSENIFNNREYLSNEN